MNSIWTKKWKAVFIWMSAFLNFIAFAIVGGYCIIKSEDEDLKRVTKQAFIVTIVFSAISAVLSIINYLGSFGDNYYSSDLYDFYSTCSTLVSLARLVVFAVFVVLTFVKNDTPAPISEEGSDNGEA
ncbi:MAG: hypothetical protein J6B29_05680 [Clostridia bacterium]|nr:hypothetical protein [Clostridia bacterium]